MILVTRVEAERIFLLSEPYGLKMVIAIQPNIQAFLLINQLFPSLSKNMQR